MENLTQDFTMLKISWASILTLKHGYFVSACKKFSY